MLSTSNSNVNNLQQYCLRWKQHNNNLQTVFSELLERQAYCDVTLATEGRTLRAHKVVLSACSNYFDAILSQYEGRDPIIIMRGVKYCDVKALVEFIYKGETNVEFSQLSSLLKTAEDLHIKGLADVKSAPTNDDNNDEDNSLMRPEVEAIAQEEDTNKSPIPTKKRRGRPPLNESEAPHDMFIQKFSGRMDSEYVSEDDHDNWNDETRMLERNENNSLLMSTPHFSKDNVMKDFERRGSNTSAAASWIKASQFYSNNQNFDDFDIPEQFRDAIRLKDYLKISGATRQKFWQEPFTKRIMTAIKNKELEMRTAEKILGVPYNTLWCRYHNKHGPLKNSQRTQDISSEVSTPEISMLSMGKEINFSLMNQSASEYSTAHSLAKNLLASPSIGRMLTSNTSVSNSVQESPKNGKEQIYNISTEFPGGVSVTPVNHRGNYPEIPSNVPLVEKNESLGDLTTIKTEND